MKEKLLKKLSTILEDNITLPSDVELDMECHLFNDLRMDSLDSVEFIMEVERSFEINIPDSAIHPITTLGECVEYLVENHSESLK